MSYKSDCHYIHFQDKSTLGWLWRLELLPAISTAQTAYNDGANNTFVEFSDNIILLDEAIEFESAYSDQPLGIATTPTMKLSFATDNMTSDEFDCIVKNEGWDTGGDYDIHVTNVWVLRCDYGTGTIDGTSDIFFMGIQRADGGYEEQIDQYGKSKCSIEIVNALSELARITTAEKFGWFVFNTYLPATAGSYRKQGIIYQQIFSNKGNVTENFGNNRAVFVNTVYLSLFATAHVAALLREFFRVAGATVKCLRLSHDQLKLYEQKTDDTSGSTNGLIGNIAALAYEEATAPNEQDARLICATLLDDAADLSDYADVGHGLLVKSSSSGSLFEGETLHDILSNCCLSWGGKQAYIIRDNKLVLTSGKMLGDLSLAADADSLTLDLGTQCLGEVKIATGAQGGSIRSATFNVDTSGSDDDSEFKYQIGGNLSEVDYSAKCVIHTNPRIKEYDKKWGIQKFNTDLDGGFGEQTKINFSWRSAPYDLRKFWYVKTVSNFSSGLADHKLMLRAHALVEYHDGRSWQSITPPTYVMDKDKWMGTFLEQQRTIGIPNTLARFVGIALSNSKRAVVECKVSLDVLDINDIGRTVKVTFSGLVSKYAYLHDTGETFTKAILLSVKSSAIAGTSDVKLLILPV